MFRNTRKINTNRFSQIHFQSVDALRECLKILRQDNGDAKQKAMMWKILNSNAGQVWSLGLSEKDYEKLSMLEQSMLNLVVIKKGSRLNTLEQRPYCETEVDIFFSHNEIIKLENELEIMRLLILAQKRGASSLHSLRLQMLKNFSF